jgi:transketolase
MGAAINGIALSRALIPYGATFLVFSDYCKPAIRLSAFMKTQSIWVFTHDSIGLGEDGPTHQPIEQLATLRSIPGLISIRPADANEVAVAWRFAIERRDGPTALMLTRQKIPVFDRTQFPPASDLLKGGYIFAGGEAKPDLILLASGSEFQFALGAWEQLVKEGLKVRLVAMPSMELFDRQSEEYREKVLPSAVRKRLAVEAGHPMCWYKYVGLDGGLVCMNRYGASAPFKVLLDKFGFSAKNVAAAAKALL